MTLFLNCQSIEKSYGSQQLLKGLSFSLFSGDRVGLIGPNGSGKSTLLKILAGIETADNGLISPKRDLSIGYVSQNNDFKDLSVKSILMEACSHLVDYQKENLAHVWLSKFQFKDFNASAANLSGGWKKKLALAQALITSPDLLLLDEPTNHLDLESVLWLEKFLLNEVTTFICVSHDRTFLQNIANRIIEMNTIYPEGLFSVKGRFLEFLEKKEQFLEGQKERERAVASKARREMEWLKKSPKARLAKAEARIEKAEEVLNEHSELKKRNLVRKAEISFEASERETKKLVVCKNLSVEMGGKLLFQHLDFTLFQKTRLGLVGPNGSGKTTLLKLLSGEIEPIQGTIKRADALKIAYFDQHRAELPDTLTLKEALCPDGDYVYFRGQSIHVNGWCKRFLFSPDFLGMPVGSLSGGERARIHIARLMLEPADLLLLDEPANDLDMATLQTLEENLLDFSGAVVLITHDRSMLERICNQFLILGNLNPKVYAEFSQWESICRKGSSISEKSPPKTKNENKAPTSSKRKLSYNEKREYDQIESLIAKEEENLRKLNLTLGLEETIQNPNKLKSVCQSIHETEKKIEHYYLRFQELDALQNGH